MLNKTGEAFRDLLAPDQILCDPAALQQYGRDWLKDFTPDPACVLLPRTTEEVRNIVLRCRRDKLALVPSGGRTGLSGGATATRREIVISLEKMNRIMELDRAQATIRCEAGVTTQALQDAAAPANLFLPVDFASKGTSQIGGNIATNAGGIRVLKYGNIRNWILDLRVVLGTGDVLERPAPLFKNQTGYDLNSLIIGSEGTLGIITEATLKLLRKPQDLVRVLCGVDSTEDVLEILAELRAFNSGLSVFEYFPRLGLEKVLKRHAIPDPFPQSYRHYLLIEFEEVAPAVQESVEELFAGYLEHKRLAHLILSQNTRQLRELLELRELLPEALSSMHTIHKNDIAVPVNRICEFLGWLDAFFKSEVPDWEVVVFGHIADGNLHVNTLKPEGLGNLEFFDRCSALDDGLFQQVRALGGTVSAEHGVGLLKKPFLHYTRSPLELDLMRGIKTLFDPDGLLNPGKIF